MIHDVTDQFVKAETPWDGGTARLHEAFDEPIQRLQQGLYASVYANPFSVDVYDNNAKKKVVIKAQSKSFKFGKFEGGLIERQRTNWKHLHTDSESGGVQFAIYPKCLQRLWVLDLTGKRVGSLWHARVFEKYWNGELEAYLKRQNLLEGEQKGRSEWRHLGITQLDAREVTALMGRLAERIEAAAKALSD